MTTKAWDPDADTYADLLEDVVIGERIAEHLPGQHSQKAHGRGLGGMPEAQAATIGDFEVRVATEEHARNPRPGYGGTFGDERGMVVSPDGEVLWQGGGSRTAIDDPGMAAAMKTPGAAITHFHPDSRPEAHLNTNDINQALRSGATMRAFNANGAWVQFKPNGPGLGSLGITDQDLYGAGVRDFDAAYKELTAGRGEWTSGRHEGIAEAEPPDEFDPGAPFSDDFRRKIIRASRKGEAIIQARTLEANLYKMSTEQVADMKALIEQARKDTIEAMSNATKEWAYKDRQAVLDSLDTVLARMDQQMTSQLRAAQDDAWAQGTDVQGAIEQSIGMSMSTKPNIDPSVLATAMQTTPELITGITSDIRRQIGTMIRLGALGQKSPLTLMREMGTVAGKGPWSSAFLRGEVIYRTEIGRMFQQASQARLSAHQRDDPTWKKKWVAVHDTRTRDTHRRADGQVVPADKPFEVGDAKLMFPGDPAGLARETINCRCVSIPWRDEWDRIDEPDTPEERWQRDFDDGMNRELADLDRRTTKWWDDYRKALAADTEGGYRASMRAEQAAARANGGDWLSVLHSTIDRMRGSLKGPNLSAMSADDALAFANRVNAMALRYRKMAADLQTPYPGGSTYADSAIRSMTARAGLLREMAVQLEIMALKARLNLPLEQRVKPRPEGKSLTAKGEQRIYDTLLANGKWLESIGLRTAWDGGVHYGGAGRYAGVYNWGSISINKNTLKYREDNYEKVLLHEQLHGVSDYYSTGPRVAYSSFRGWEEGVVEGLTQVLLRKQGRTAYTTYAQYVEPLETLRRYLDMDGEEFYTALIRTTLADRPKWVQDRLNEYYSGGDSVSRKRRDMALGYLASIMGRMARK